MKKKLVKFKNFVRENPEVIALFVFNLSGIVASSLYGIHDKRELDYIRSREWRLHEDPELLEMLKDEASQIKVRLHGRKMLLWTSVPKS